MNKCYDMDGTLIQVGDTVEWYENGEVWLTLSLWML